MLRLVRTQRQQEPVPSALAPDTPSAGKSPNPSVGQLLRAARESKGLTIDTIAQETKIGKRLLESLERDDYDNLPGGIFNRAFIRAFAREVGLDGEQGVTLYEKAVAAQRKGEDRSRDRSQQRELVLVAGGILLALLLSIGLYYSC